MSQQQLSPVSAEFIMPAEWAEHAATWLSLPHNSKDWPGKFQPIGWVYGEIIRMLTRSGEKVRVIVSNEKQRESLLKILRKTHADLTLVETFFIASDRSWTRDTGPIFVYSKEEHQKHIAGFGFTGWAKYPNYLNDEHISLKASAMTNIPLVMPMYNEKRVVLEGGAIDVNGRGVMLTTEECLLHPTIQVRNEGFSRTDYEEVFKKYLGIEQTLWLGNGIAGDDTHGHVDDLCRFVNEHTVVLCDTDNHNDSNYALLKENHERLQGVKLHTGEQLEVISLPMPAPLWFDGIQLPASYANFYIGNHVVLVPTFNDPNDRVALGLLQELFPNRTVIGIHAVDLVWGFGTLHCLSQQEPM